MNAENIQVRINFITDEGKQMAKSVKDTQALNKEILDARKAIKEYEKELKSTNLSEEKRLSILENIKIEEGTVFAAMQKIVAAGGDISKIDLSKVAPVTLSARMKQLAENMKLIPSYAPEWQAMRKEFELIDDHLKKINGKAKAIVPVLDEVNQKTTFWGRAMETAVGVFGGLSLENIASQLLSYAARLFDIGTAQDSLAQKTATVFGYSERIVQEYANRLAQSLGLAKKEFVNLATGVGDLLIPMGFTQEQAARLSSELVKQAGVLSEWTGGKVSTAQATEVLQKALLGERDALNSLGIDIKQELVDAELRERGQDKLTGAAKRQAEALITLQLITQQSASANTAFEKNTDSLVRKKAQFKAQLAEVTEGLAGGFIPVVGWAIEIGAGLLALLVGVGKVLIGIPKFIYDNRDAFGLLTVGIVTLNWQLVVFNAQLLAWRAAAAIYATWSGIATAATWYWNTALAANPIGLIITALALFALEIKHAYKEFEGFRAVIDGLWEATKEFINYIRVAWNVVTGDFGEAAELYSKGKNLGKAFSDGYNQSIQEGREKQDLEDRKEQERDRAAYEAEQNKGSERRKKTREEIEAERKEAFEKAQKQLENHNAQRELELERRRQSEGLSEKAYQYALLEIKRQAAAEELAMLRRHKGAVATETLKAAKSLLEIEEKARDAHFALLNERQLTDEERDIEELKRLTNYKEQEHEITLDYLKKDVEEFSDAKRQQYEAEEKWVAEQKRFAEEQKKRSDDLTKKELENEKKKKQERRAAADAGMTAISDIFQLQADFLSKDEASRKKNADRIKRAQRGQVIVQGIAEVAKIWANSAEYGPILGPIIGAVQTGIAIARTALAVRNINGQTFAGGGFTGRGFGFRDHTGHRPAGVVHQNEWVAPEWMTQHPTWGKYIQAFEGVRQRGFADGGFATTPTFTSLPPTNSDASMALLQEYRSFRRDISAWQSSLRVSVIYSDIEDAGSTLASIQATAAL